MEVEKMSGIYIPGAKIPNGNYVRVLMLHKDGTCVDGIGNVFKVIPVPPHGRCIDAEKIYDAVEQRYRMSSGIEHRCERDFLDLICAAPTIIQAEEGEA